MQDLANKLPSPHQALWRDLKACSSATARELVPLEAAEALNVLPVALMESSPGSHSLIVIAGRELSLQELASLRFISGHDIILQTAAPSEVARAIFAAYHGERGAILSSIAECSAALSVERTDTDPEPVKEQGVPALLNRILLRAIAETASDIHIEPQRERTIIRLRVDGSLREQPEISLFPQLAVMLGRRIKILSQIEITGRGMCADGGFTFEHAGRAVRVRVSVVPQLFGEKFVLRMLDSCSISDGEPETSLSQLGLTTEQLAVLNGFLGCESGALIAAGPTGSGKSTLLATLLRSLNTPWRNIISVEDPVEQAIDGVNQIDLSRCPGVTYANVLPSLLRQDPDVLMVGEIRETASARLAFEAALTGHLLLTTVHGGNCLEALVRTLELAQAPHLVLASVRVFVSSRLVPRVCNRCVQCSTITPSLAQLLGLSPALDVASGKGCEACNFSGQRGRIGVFEILSLTHGIREIAQVVPLDLQGLQRAASESGYRPFVHQVRARLAAREISPAQALRTLGIAPEAFGYTL